MSIEAVNQFMQKVSEDVSLQSELTKALNSENASQAATELAAKNGYMFSSEELSAEIKSHQSEFSLNSSEEEISEEELEAVAGGISALITLRKNNKFLTGRFKK